MNRDIHHNICEYLPFIDKATLSITSKTMHEIGIVQHITQIESSLNNLKKKLQHNGLTIQDEEQLSQTPSPTKETESKASKLFSLLQEIESFTKNLVQCSLEEERRDAIFSAFNKLSHAELNKSPVYKYILSEICSAINNNSEIPFTPSHFLPLFSYPSSLKNSAQSLKCVLERAKQDSLENLPLLAEAKIDQLKNIPKNKFYTMEDAIVDQIKTIEPAFSPYLVNTIEELVRQPANPNVRNKINNFFKRELQNCYKNKDLKEDSEGTTEHILATLVAANILLSHSFAPLERLFKEASLLFPIDEISTATFLKQVIVITSGLGFKYEELSPIIETQISSKKHRPSFLRYRIENDFLSLALKSSPTLEELKKLASELDKEVGQSSKVWRELIARLENRYPDFLVSHHKDLLEMIEKKVTDQLEYLRLKNFLQKSVRLCLQGKTSENNAASDYIDHLKYKDWKTDEDKLFLLYKFTSDPQLTREHEDKLIELVRSMQDADIKAKAQFSLLKSLR